MKFEKTPICLITDEKQRFYYTDYMSTDGYVILQENKTTFVVDSRYLYEAQQVLLPKGIEVVLGSNLDALKSRVASIGATTVGIDFTLTSIKEFERLKLALPGITFVDVNSDIISDMTVKTEEELARIKTACEIAQKAYYEVLPLLKVGVTEREIANELEYRFKKYGASGKSFDTIVGFGANSAVPHHETGEDTLKENSVVLMDFGCVYKGYCSDMTRTCFFGEPDEEFVSAYNAVYDAHMNALNNIHAGMSGIEADALARDVLKDCGRADVFTHSLGHGIGTHIHEYPNLSPRANNILDNNMVFSDEPGVYYDGKFGIRIEDSCYLKDGVAHTFMTDDKHLIIVK